MAEAYIASIEEELTCCVCYELFVHPHTPKELNCPHVICELCLKLLVKIGAIIECPNCRVITKLPKDGVPALRTNLGLCNLAEKHVKYLKRQQCEIDHQTNSQAKDDQVHVCSRNRGETDLVCETCFLITNQENIFVDLYDQYTQQFKDVKRSHEDQLKYLRQIVSKIRNLYQREFQDLEVTKQKVLLSIADEEKKIDASGREAKAKVDRQCSNLKAELQIMHEPKLQECQQQEEVLRRKASEFQKILADAKQTEVNTHHEFVKQIDILITKLKILESQQTVPYDVKQHPENVKFQTEQLKFQIGRLTLEQRAATRKHNQDMQRKLNLSTELCGFHGKIESVASNVNGSGSVLTVSENNSNEAHIYCKRRNGQYKRQFSFSVPDDYEKMVDNETGRTCVAIGGDGKIYVARNRTVHKFSPTGENHNVLYTCKQKSSGYFTCIAVIPDGRIIVSNSAKSAIMILTPDGKLVKTIQTRCVPTSIAVVKETQFAVCCEKEGQIDVVDLDTGQGKLTVSVRCRNPSTIYCDKETDSLLVSGYSDTHDDVVIEQYSLATGGFIACIVQGLGCSPAMTFAGNDTLVVGDDEVVKIYSAVYSIAV